ncbi:MAG: nuclear transport factor 2 family protein, partial [Polynucleobacter victoriensis]
MTSLRIQNVIAQFESLSPQSVNQLTNLYASDAVFKDPFNAVKGHNAIKHIFLHMFNQVNNPRFVIKSVLENDQHASLTWEFEFQFKSSPNQSEIIKGCTWFTFDQQDL